MIMEQTDRRIALVTGANKGIGLEIARQLGRADVTVLLAARDTARGQAAARVLSQEGLYVQSLQLDVTDAASVKTAALWIAARYGRLDILVNNAGISDSQNGPPTSASVEAARRLLETNFLGALAVTQAMLPLLRQSL
jgi:NAD(P)-dependent dehydrogenase (short-subunit alcohol dehydrogenase family)